jgi:molecular chaperone DnaJ
LLREKPGTQSGSRHRVKGKGIATSNKTGDLIVTVDIAVPAHLNDEERAAVEALAKASTFQPRARLGDAVGSAEGR